MQLAPRPDHSCLHDVQMTSLQLQCPQSQLLVDFAASVSVRVPHKHWALGENPLWRALAVEGSQNVPLDIKLLWNHGALPEAWSSLAEFLGQAISEAALWGQLGLVASLAIPSHDSVSLTLHSTYHIALPPDLLLPTSAIQAIRWTLAFTSISQVHVACPPLQHIQPLVDDCINSFLNDRRGAPAIAGGLLTPGISQQIRSAMTSIEAITSTLARYASQCDDYGQFRLKIETLKETIASVSHVTDEAIDLQGIIKGQVYHQIMRALQSTRSRKRTKFTSSNSENELLSKPLERFQDLFEDSRALLSNEEAGDEGEAANGEAEQSDFEDLFEECDDNYSDFEDLLEETQETRPPNQENTDMIPDSPAPAPPQNILNSQHSQNHDFDMTSDRSESEYTMLDDSLATSASAYACEGDDYNDFCDIESSQPPMPYSILIEKNLESAPGKEASLAFRTKNVVDEEERMLMML
ncbi:hypothetical protein TWF696_000035 [Orbilia brochopaga]|uniref:Uncharacterized protein n=1 Tax=Orbilia brochopaga TaxID=3140254 RepID=A0AAV9VGI0_9PEZI